MTWMQRLRVLPTLAALGVGYRERVRRVLAGCQSRDAVHLDSELALGGKHF
jgi:hypothetical protein